MSHYRSSLKSLSCLAAVTLLASGSESRNDQPIRESDYTETIRVACVGDSITYGYGFKDRAHESYPAQLATRLGKNWEVRNFGFNGATVLKNGTKPYTGLPVYRDALAFRSHVVIIKLGTNDTNAKSWPAHGKEFVTDYLEIISAFERLEPKPRIYLCQPVPLFRDRGKAYDTDKILTEQILPQIKEIARRKRLPVIDLHAEFENRSGMLPDGVHPDAAGARLMAEKIHAVLTGQAQQPD
jgi:lysophospholipase L1-like esterase